MATPARAEPHAPPMKWPSSALTTMTHFALDEVGNAILDAATERADALLLSIRLPYALEKNLVLFRPSASRQVAALISEVDVPSDHVTVTERAKPLGHAWSIETLFTKTELPAPAGSPGDARCDLLGELHPVERHRRRPRVVGALAVRVRHALEVGDLGSAPDVDLVGGVAARRRAEVRRDDVALVGDALRRGALSRRRSSECPRASPRSSFATPGNGRCTSGFACRSTARCSRRTRRSVPRWPAPGALERATTRGSLAGRPRTGSSPSAAC